MWWLWFCDLLIQSYYGWAYHSPTPDSELQDRSGYDVTSHERWRLSEASASTWHSQTGWFVSRVKGLANSRWYMGSSCFTVAQSMITGHIKMISCLFIICHINQGHMYLTNLLIAVQNLSEDDSSMPPWSGNGEVVRLMNVERSISRLVKVFIWGWVHIVRYTWCIYFSDWLGITLYL